MRKFLFIALVLLVGTNIFLFKRLDSVKKERNRLDSNQAALLSDVEHYKTEAGKNATSVLRLELTKNELEKKNKDLTKTVDDLNIKLKRIQAATTTATKTEIEIKTKVRDSIVYRNELDTLLNFRSANLSDDHNTPHKIVMNYHSGGAGTEFLFSQNL